LFINGGRLQAGDRQLHRLVRQASRQDNHAISTSIRCTKARSLSEKTAGKELAENAKKEPLEAVESAAGSK